MRRRLGLLVSGALAGLLVGPLFFDESGPGFEAHAISMLLGAFLAVVLYEVGRRRRSRV